MKTHILSGLVIGSFVAISGCDIGCENEVLNTVVSPNGSKKAVVFARGCGATTGESTQVSIVPTWRGPPSGGGNTLVVEGRTPLQVRWVGSTELALSKLGSGRIFKQEGEVNGVAVRYEYAL